MVMINCSGSGASGHGQSGFTILEVLVALTITALVLGSLFSLAVGSKQLAFRSDQSLHRAVQARAAVNFALLQDEYAEVELAIDNDRFAIREEDYLDAVTRKTEAHRFKLQHYAVLDTENDERIEGTRWVRLELEE